MPRTTTTRKLRRAEIASAIAQGVRQPLSKPGTDLAGLIRKYAPGRAIGPETTIEELGLSSLDRVELMMDLEEKLDTSIDESAFASVSKVADLAKPLSGGRGDFVSHLQPGLDREADPRHRARRHPPSAHP